MWNEKKDICLIFVGEDFTDHDVIAGLRGCGHDFAPGTAAYLVHQYEDKGPAFLTRLNGWFCGVLIDLREQKAILFNDRYGASRLFFHENEDGLYFASEARALLRVLPETRRLDFKSVGEFLSCGSVLQNRTLFSGISLLPGAAQWTFSRDRTLRKESYFEPSQWEARSPLEPEPFYQQFKATWARILPKYFRGGDQLGLSLTGGVDSRMVLSWAPEEVRGLPCYTWGGSYRDCKDVVLARRIAGIAGCPHQVIPVGNEFITGFPSLAEEAVRISDGGMDVTGAIDLFVQRKARQIATGRLGGVYGGEILRQLVMFKPVATKNDHLDHVVIRSINDSFTTYKTELRGHRLSFTAFKQAPWHMTGKFAIEASQVIYRTPYFDNELVALAYQSPPEAIIGNGYSLRLIADGNPALARIETDRALAYHSVPGLTRLLHAWQEFTFKAEYAYDYGMPQRLARLDHLFAPLHLERLFLGRHKFHHFRVWYRDQLAGYVKEMLLDPRTLQRPYLKAAGLEEMVMGHTRGVRNYTLEIHKMLALELVQRQLIETN